LLAGLGASGCDTGIGRHAAGAGRADCRLQRAAGRECALCCFQLRSLGREAAGGKGVVRPIIIACCLKKQRREFGGRTLAHFGTQVVDRSIRSASQSSSQEPAPALEAPGISRGHPARRRTPPQPLLASAALTHLHFKYPLFRASPAGVRGIEMSCPLGYLQSRAVNASHPRGLGKDRYPCSTFADGKYEDGYGSCQVDPSTAAHRPPAGVSSTPIARKQLRSPASSSCSAVKLQRLLGSALLSGSKLHASPLPLHRRRRRPRVVHFSRFSLC